VQNAVVSQELGLNRRIIAQYEFPC